MNPTTQSSNTSTHPARQQRILHLPEVKAKTGFGRLALDWLRYLTQNSVQVRSVFQNVRQCFLVSLLPEVDGQVRRVAEKFALLASAGLSPDRAAKALMAVNYLVPDGNRPQRKVSLPDNTRPRMYCVKGSILDD